MKKEKSRETDIDALLDELKQQTSEARECCENGEVLDESRLEQKIKMISVVTRTLSQVINEN